MSFSQPERHRIAHRLLQLRDACANAVTDELYGEAAACAKQFGDPGRQHCRNDLAMHIEFLAASIEANSLKMFKGYLKWCDGVLASRGVQCEPSARTAERIVQHLCRMLSSDEQTALTDLLAGSVGDVDEGEWLQPDDSNVPERLRGAREAYLGALLAAQRSAAITVAEQCLIDGFELADVYVDVIAAAMHRIGVLWQMNRITVAQEHIATAITQTVIAALYTRILHLQPPKGRAVVTGVAGETHQVGANLLADALESKGWSVSFLGSNLPTSALLDAVAESDPDTLCISTTLAVHLPVAAEFIQQVRHRFGPLRPSIFVGGAAFNLSPAAYIEELGVRRADLRDALRILCPDDVAQAPY